MLKYVLFGANKYLLRKIVLKRLPEKLKQIIHLVRSGTIFTDSFIGKTYLLLRCLYPCATAYTSVKDSPHPEAYLS